MATTKFSVSAYTADGVTTDFLITWDYLDEDHIAVYVDGTPNYDPTSTYTFEQINATTLRITDEFGNAVPSGSAIEIRRETPIATRAVTFVDGSSFLAEDLNKNSDYLLYSMQEALDTVEAAAQDGALAAQVATEAFRDETQVLRNETEVLKDTTGTYLSTVQADATAADNHRIAAAASEAAAATSETNAATSEANAAASATASATSATNAAASAAAAATSETNIGNAEVNSAASAAAALTSETNAASSATAAATSASNAAASETSAATQATNAATSASNAATSAANAAASETNASNSATAASSSETNAATSASNAATSATSASGSAAAAATSATDAATSETNAAASATAAATSETNAAASATDAANSASSVAGTLAAVEAVYDQFDDRYLGPKATDPTVDNDGNPLVQGTLYFSTSENVMKVYDGANWDAATSAGGASLLNYNFTATAGQTAFSGADDNSQTLSYVQSNIIVTLNGITLEDGTDYTATDGITITLTSAASAGDELNVVAFKTFAVADTVSASNGGTFSNPITVSRATSNGTIIDLQKDGSSVGSIGTPFTGELYIQGTGANSSGLLFTSGNTIQPRKNNAADDGNIDIGTGGNRFKDLYLSGGVYLGGTGSANYLDDYETGTWTPSVVGAATAGSYGNIIVAFGAYTKVGNIVTANVVFAAQTGTGSGDMLIQGFPFTCSTESGAVLQYNQGLALPSGTNTPVALIFAGATQVVVRCNSDGTGSYVPMPYPTNPLYIRLTITYPTND